MNLAYLAPIIPATLLSLCYMQTALILLAPTLTVSFPPLSTASSLHPTLPINLSSLRSAALAHSTHYLIPPDPTSYLLTAAHHTISMEGFMKH